MIHLFATEPHYKRHVRAVWKHLPDELRGNVFLGRAASIRSTPAKDYVMVGGFNDIDRVQRHRLIYVEHGAGQTYQDAGRLKEAYAHPDSKHPDRVVAYISPRAELAEAWGRPAFAAGCPALDEVVRAPISPKTAAITFHWDAWQVSPEARSARNHWKKHLERMVRLLEDYGFEVVGHGHPRDRDAKPIWLDRGVEWIPDPDVILSDISLLIADNTSLMYEAAAVGIPVAVLNAPWYRRDVSHGLRFWDNVPGRQFDTIEEFESFDWDAYVVEDPFRRQREAAAVAAYDRMPDGEAGIRAARWLTRLVTEK